LVLQEQKKTMDMFSITINMVGTLSYMSPELLDQHIFNFKSDVYSYGIVMCEVMNQKVPYHDYEFDSQTKFMLDIINNELRPSFDGFDMNDQTFLEISRLAQLCWNKDPKMRPSMANITILLDYLQDRSKKYEFWDWNPQKTISLWEEDQSCAILHLFYAGALRKQNKDASEIINNYLQSKDPLLAGIASYISKDFKNSLLLLEKVELNHLAQYLMGRIYDIEFKDVGRAIKCYQGSSDQLNINAWVNLGTCFAKGEGTTQNYAESFRLYNLASIHGNSMAQFNLASCYAQGHGVTQDASQYIKILTTSANQGLVHAQFRLGHCYMTGTCIKRDFTLAIKYLILTSEQGDSDATKQLGTLYFTGEGVQKDYNIAFTYFRLASDRGNISATANVGECYYYGRGYPTGFSTSCDILSSRCRKWKCDGSVWIGILL
jgi:TPR repeat protein